MLTAEVVSLLESPEKGFLLIITVGNPFRSDDGVGPYIAARIHLPKTGLQILNAGDTPENAALEAVKLRPSRVIIVDAADFGGTPGEARVISEDSIPEKTFSTHRFPLRIIAKIVREDTGAEVFFVGIQPEKVEFGEGLSLPVNKTATEIIKALSHNKWVD